MFTFLTSGDSNDTNNELKGDHARSTNNENGTTTETFDGPESEWSRQTID